VDGFSPFPKAFWLTPKRTLGAWRTVFSCVVGLFVGATAEALLPYLPLDFYVRHADRIVIGQVQETGAVVVVGVTETLLGSKIPTLRVTGHGLSGWEEDEPIYTVGQKALLFLRPTDGGSQLDSVQAEGGKVDFEGGRVRSHVFPDYDQETFVTLVKRFVGVREEPSVQAKYRLLMQLLESKDVFVIASASEYLNYLVNGQDDEDWLIKPRDSEDWSYTKYYERNALAHKRAWKKWWLSQQ